MNYTPSQRDAVEAWGGDVCVVAGPGSGKTTVLVERLRWLVREKRVDPARTLFNVISKSGATAETMAQYLVVRERLDTEIGADNAMVSHHLRKHGGTWNTLVSNEEAADPEIAARTVDHPHPHSFRLPVVVDLPKRNLRVRAIYPH